MKKDMTLSEFIQMKDVEEFFETRVNQDLEVENNFLNKFRYTDTEGGQAYIDSIVIDHLYGMGYDFKIEEV